MAEKIVYDYSKLLGLMKEKGITQYDLADAINISEKSLSSKLNNNRNFKQAEIDLAVLFLKINDEDVTTYFFTHNVH